ncbi:MAG: RHS repeat-associated core domain-containing protein, partial [Planctomycetaceae bacterium]|nr:RHS repeat-associated core domain-containing protein [Planctomycetaceae bacterium]
ARIKYGHDYASNRTWREDVIAENDSVDLDELYTYDGLDRLATVERGEINGTYTTISSDTFGQTWDLDQLNNWDNFTEDDDGNGTDDLDQDRTHNDVNEITAITATTGANWVDPTHDAAGNTITGPTPGDETATQKYTYDAWNRMTKVTDGSDTTIGEYAYDGRNYRITKAIHDAGTLTHTDHFYYNENWQALEVRREISGTEDPDPREQYVWHPDYIDSLAVRYFDADTDGNLAENSDGPHYYTQGANYHVLAITDDSGTVLERYHYDPYGRLSVRDADFTTDADGASDIDNPYTFTGRRLDEESGLYSFRNRYYDMVSGRFTSRDPLDYEDGGSLYSAYLVPSNVDPSGLRSINDILDDAELRNGHGPWGFSAAHCWAACYFGAVFGAGNLAAGIADIGEIIAPSNDSWRDIRAQHHGAALGNVFAWWDLCGDPGSTPEDYCDAACNTWP